MKKLILLLFVSACMSAFAQEKTTTNSQTQPTQARTSATSIKAESTPLPYNVNDKYMGRRDEFLNNLTVKELPADFPVYEKQWSLKDYNAVVDAYYTNHMDILKPKVKQKMQYHIDQQKTN